MATSCFDWHPGKLLQGSDQTADFALLVLNQPLKNNTTLRCLWKNAVIRVAADGGANRLHQLSSFQGKFSNLQAIVGDLDSLEPDVRAFYTSQPTPAEVVHEADQESTDFEKTLKWIRKPERGNIDIVTLGGLGGRVDQGVRLLHDLYLCHQEADYADGRTYLVSDASLTFLLKAGSHNIHLREEGERGVFGKHTGIMPMLEPSVITTRGLRWDVQDWETRFGGNFSTNNQVLPDTRVIEVETTKEVLFTIALRQGDGDDPDER